MNLKSQMSSLLDSLLWLTLTCLFLSLCTTASSDVDDTTCDADHQQQDRRTLQEQPIECVLYLAQSSIPNAGYGIYTAKSFRQGDMIIEKDGPGIAVTDPWSPIHALATHVKLFDDVWWGEHNMDDHVRFEAQDVADFQILFGALPNFHPYLSNLDNQTPKNVYDDTLANRTTDPGAGAFSYHLGKDFLAYQDIAAASELFLSYGESWFDERQGYEDVPREANYVQVGKILERLFTSSLLNITTKEEEEDGKRFQIQEQPSMEREVNLILASAYETTMAISKRTASLFPKTLDEMQRVLSAAKSLEPKDLSLAVATQLSVIPRSIEWIHEHGMCLDHIIAGRSRVAQAGRGAFAQRSLKQGERIVPVPLLHIEDKRALATYKTSVYEDTGRLVRHESEKVGEELLVNYCFGHRESTLLLCPVTNAILINHCSDRRGECGEKGPNAKYEWATEWDENTKENLGKTLEELSSTKQWRLVSLDIIATRPIASGEEIFIDYGPEWEKAWESHVENWKPPAEGSGFESHSSVTLENLKIPVEVYLTDVRDEHSPAGDMFTACVYEQYGKDEYEEWVGEQESGDEWKALDTYEIVEIFGRDGSQHGPPQFLGDFWPCSIVASSEDEDDYDDDEVSYVVRIFQDKANPRTEWYKKELPRILVNYPPTSVRYFTKPYKSDQHLPGAFRHPIEIRDDLFPEQWKNLKDEVISQDDPPLSKFDRVYVHDLGTREWHKCRILRILGDGKYDAACDDEFIQRNVPHEGIWPAETSRYLDLVPFFA